MRQREVQVKDGGKTEQGCEEIRQKFRLKIHVKMNIAKKSDRQTEVQAKDAGKTEQCEKVRQTEVQAKDAGKTEQYEDRSPG